jgi:hypothetical protein
MNLFDLFEDKTVLKELAPPGGHQGVAEGLGNFIKSNAKNFASAIGLNPASPDSFTSTEQDIERGVMPVYQDLIKRIAQSGGIEQQRTNGLVNTAERLLQQIYRYEKTPLTKQNYAKLVTDRIKQDVAQAIGKQGVAEAKWDPWTGGDFSDEHDMNHLSQNDAEETDRKRQAEKLKAMIQYYGNDALVSRALDDLYRVTLGGGYYDSIVPPNRVLATIVYQSLQPGKTEKRYFPNKQEAYSYAKGYNAIVTNLEKIDNQEDTSDLITLPVILGLGDHKKKWMLKFPSEDYAQKWEFKHKNVAKIQWPAGHGLAEEAGPVQARAVDAKGRTQQEWLALVKSKFPNAKILQAKMIDGPCVAILPNGKQLHWKKVEQGVAEGKDDNYYRVEQRDRNGKLQGVYHKSSLNYPLQNIVSDCAYYQKQNPGSTFQLFVDGQPADWKKLYQHAKQQDMAEDSTNFRVYRVPELNRSLPGVSTAAQKTTQFMNLKQNQPYVKRLIPSPTGHLQVSVNAQMIGQRDGGALIKGNTIDSSGRKAYSKPWSIMIDGDGNIVTQDLSRLNDDELAAVEYNLVTRNRLLQPNQIAQAVAESRVLGEKRQAKTTHDPVSDPLLNYTGVNHRVKSLLKKARAENPGARNDIEAVFAHVASGDSLDQQQEQRLQQQQQQIADLAEKLIQSQENYNKQELRFQQLNDKIRRQGGQATAQDVTNAQAADQIARQGMTEDDEEHRPIPAKSIIQGYTVFWDPETRTAYITKGGHDKEAALAHVKIGTPMYKNFINAVTRSIDQLDQELSGDLAESLRPGEYHVWTVHLDDGTQRRFRVPSDEYPDERIKAYYARKGKQVVKIDYDWAVHSDHMDENNQGPEYRAVKPVPANYGGGHLQGQPQKITFNTKPSAQIRGRTIKSEPVAVKETKPLSARERLQQEVDRIKQQEREMRTGLTGLDHERVQQQLEGIGDRVKPKKVDEVSGYLTQEPKPLTYAQRIRRLVAQYQTKPAMLGTLAREKGSDSDEQIAFDYIRTGKLRHEPGEQSANINWNDVVRGISTQPTLGGQDLLNAAAAELKKMGYGTTPETRDLMNSVLNGSPELHRQLQIAYDRKIAKSRELAEDKDTEGVERAILHRIMVGHKDLLLKYGPQKVMQAAEEVAYNVGDISEIGTSDVSGWVRQVEQILGVPQEQLAEKWSQKYKRSIDCSHPKGFSQRAHCQGRKKK